MTPNLSVAQSVIDSDFTQPLIHGQVLALGGAYRGLANDNNAVLLNPAGIMQNQHLAVSGEWMDSGTNDAQVFGGAIVDTRSEEMFGYGIAYNYINELVVGNEVTMHHAVLAMATKVTPNFMLGVSGKYFRSTVETPTVAGPDGVTADIGVLWYLIPSLSVGGVIQNFIEGTDNPNVPLLMTAGICLRPDQNSGLLFDIVQDLSTSNTESTNLHFGGQYAFSEDFTLRAGYGLDRVRDDPFVGVGLLLTAPKALLGFTYARHFHPEEDTIAVSLELRM